MLRKPLMAATIALCLVASAVHAAGEAPRDVLFGPYVNSVDRSSAVVLWVSVPGADAGSVSAVARGRSGPVHRAPGAIQDIAGRPELLHAARLTGLRADTRYRYEVRCGKAKLEGTFRTAPPEGEPVRFAVYGDTRSRPDMHGKVGRAIAEERPHFLVNTGDLVADGRVWEQWPGQFFGPVAGLLRMTTLWPVRGNHERDAVLYRELFELPGNELFYSFDWGSVHFVVLDTHGTPEERAEMLRWLKRDLTQTDARWTFVAYHVPTFNVGGHGSSWGREEFLPVMERGGVDMVFTGHSHLYERFVPIGPIDEKPIIHVVTGGGGAPNYPALPSPILAGGIGRSTVHHCLVQVDGPRLQMTVRTPDGQVLDTLTLRKGPDGFYQDEVMALAVSTEEAADLVFAFARLAADFAGRPQAGEPVRITLDGSRFPEDSTVTVSPAAEDGRWEFEPQRIPGGEQVAFEVTPPQGVGLEGASLSPPLLVDLDIRHGEQSYSARGLEVRVSQESLRALFPPPEAVAVPPAPPALAVDGDAADWADVPPLPLPYHEARPGDVRLCWSAEGLYGLVVTEDAGVQANPEQPWRADSLEVFVDKELTRASDIHATTAQYVFSPAPDADGGRGHVLVPHGANRGRESDIPCRWRRTEGGYVLEFLLPAEFVEPARMEPGSKIGLNFALNDDGRTEQHFYASKANGGWRTPFTWGVIELIQAARR